MAGTDGDLILKVCDLCEEQGESPSLQVAALCLAGDIFSYSIYPIFPPPTLHTEHKCLRSI